MSARLRIDITPKVIAFTKIPDHFLANFSVFTEIFDEIEIRVPFDAFYPQESIERRFLPRQEHMTIFPEVFEDFLANVPINPGVFDQVIIGMLVDFLGPDKRHITFRHYLFKNV